jgi:hypothetical protein
VTESAALAEPVDNGVTPDPMPAPVLRAAAVPSDTAATVGMLRQLATAMATDHGQLGEAFVQFGKIINARLVAIETALERAGYPVQR